MTASDCYELARALFSDKEEIKAALAWMTEANQKYREENTSYPFTKVDIMNFIRSANTLLCKMFFFKYYCYSRKNFNLKYPN